MGIKKGKSLSEAAALRRRAVDRLKSHAAIVRPPLEENERQRLVHELEVHQIELEMQNEDLRQARDEAETALVKYADLYDFAPVGYLTFDLDGLIGEVNLAACRLLGIERRSLVGKPFSTFVHTVDRDAFHLHCSAVAQERTKQTLDIRLKRRDKTECVASLESIAVEDHEGKVAAIRTAMNDISEWKQAQEALQRERNQLQAVMNGAKNVHLVYLDREFNFVLVNEAYARTCGYRPEEMTGKNHFALYPNAENETIFRRVRDTGESFEVHDKPFEFPDQPERGVTYWDWSLTPLKSAAGAVEGLVFSLHETTDRKLAEETSSRTKQILKELVERAPFGIYTVDSELRIAQMNMGSQNGAFRNVRPLIGRDLHEAMRILWPETVAAEIVAHFRHTLDTGETYYSPRFINPRHDAHIVESYEWELHRIMQPDGKYGVICYYFDSTKLRNAEEALRQSEERMQLALRVSRSFTFDWHPATDKVVRSASCSDILRLSGDEALHDSGKHYFERVHPEDRGRFLQILDGLRPGADSYIAEYRVVRGDGSEAVLEEIARAMFDDTGRLTRLIGVTTDITERKRMEEALRQNMEELAKRNSELLRFNQAAVDRELRMIELKKEINELCERAGELPRYRVDFDKDQDT